MSNLVPKASDVGFAGRRQLSEVSHSLQIAACTGACNSDG